MCISPKHQKKSFPRIRCFYCHQLGHIKATCYKRKVNFIYDKLIEDFTKRKKRQQEKILKELTKDEEIKRQKKIMQKRAKEIMFELVISEKGEVFTVKIKGITIGKYIEPGLLGPTLENLKTNKFIRDLSTCWWRELLLTMSLHYMMVIQTGANTAL